jgi:hypothetical protein
VRWYVVTMVARPAIRGAVPIPCRPVIARPGVAALGRLTGWPGSGLDELRSAGPTMHRTKVVHGSASQARRLRPTSKSRCLGMPPSRRRREAEQQHGQKSRVYVPILREIVRRSYSKGDTRVEFTMRDIRQVAADLEIEIGNAGDMVYRMRARTRLPDDILDLGFTVLRGVGRGRYALEVGGDALIHMPEHEVLDHNDQTPLPVRRFLPEDLSQLDEQGLLTMVCYSKLLDHFTGLTVYRLRSHHRRTVPNIGQAELDEVDVGVALRDDEIPVVFPIEAKAADEVINRVQVATAVAYCRTYFPGHETRPIVVKLTTDGVIHFLELRPTTSLPGLRVVRSCGYRLRMSEQQRKLVRATRATLDKGAGEQPRLLFGEEDG